MANRTELSSWQALAQHAQTLRTQKIKDLFAEDQARFDKFSLQLPQFLFDYSKNLITEETQSLLLALAEEVDVAGWRDRMFAGEHLNRTEDRAVMHVALRDKSGKPIMIDGQDVRPVVEGELKRMRALVEQVRSGQWRGYSDKAITDVVSIGIGGSTLCPLSAPEAPKSHGARRAVALLQRQSDYRCGQHRYRRFQPRPPDGHRGTEVVSRWLD